MGHCQIILTFQAYITSLLEAQLLDDELVFNCRSATRTRLQLQVMEVSKAASLSAVKWHVVKKHSICLPAMSPRLWSMI